MKDTLQLYNRCMRVESPSPPDYKNKCGRYAQIKLAPGLMRVRDWKTLDLNPDLGKYAVTALPDHRLVLLPHDGGEMKHLGYSGILRISRADKESGTFQMTFEGGLLARGPSREPDPE